MDILKNRLLRCILYIFAIDIGVRYHGIALAAPIVTARASHCSSPIGCCPPTTAGKITDFVLPSPSTPLRTRPAVHSVSDDYVAKFKKALSLMKALPKDDPRNFEQQSKIHCMYCNPNGYKQAGFPDLDISVHHSWLFLPFHRCYLYFFERILGELIGDESFAIPFWNWDHPEDMTIPAIYSDPSSPLYDDVRNPEHKHPRLLDFQFHGLNLSKSKEEIIDANLKTVYRQMISNSNTTSNFMGSPYRGGEFAVGTSGALEMTPHGMVHMWVGDPYRMNRDMAALAYAGLDPIFYAHHSNIDRLWNTWKGLGAWRKDYNDPDFLNSSFLFYDEKANLVRIKIRDCLDSHKMRYTYQDVPNLWINARPTPVGNIFASQIEGKRIPVNETKFPVILDNVVSSTVARPQGSRVNKEEVLVVEGIEVDGNEFVKFDVLVNAHEFYENLSPAAREMAGSFVNVPLGQENVMVESNIQLGLTELLEQLGAGSDENIVVTIVPRTGRAKIGNVRVKLASKSA